MRELAGARRCRAGSASATATTRQGDITCSELLEDELSIQATKGANEKYCFECGSIINARAEICPKCGVRQMPVQTGIGVSSSSGRNRIVAAIFAILLGGLGIHKFYLGRVGQGILYLLFSWTLVPVLIGFIEGVVYLTMSDAAFNTKYA
jgi:TM2 domain-containing membrane protein YozV/ribosomal protein L40E